MTPKHRTAIVSREASVVAAACRAAGVVFLEGARTGWSKRDLEGWLVCDYAAVTIRIDGEESELSPESGLRPRMIAELLELVGVAVSVALRDIASEPGAVIDAAMRSGAITALRQDDGELWMPVDRADLDIETRVLSLFATDYLLNPTLYEEELSVCGACDGVSFDGFGQCPRCSTAEQSGLRRIEHFGERLESARKRG